MKKAEEEVKVITVPLLCWDIYYDYLDKKMGSRRDDFFPKKQRDLKKEKIKLKDQKEPKEPKKLGYGNY